MELKRRLQRLELRLNPPKKLPVIVVRSIDEITDIDAAMWVVIKI